MIMGICFCLRAIAAPLTANPLAPAGRRSVSALVRGARRGEATTKRGEEGGARNKLLRPGEGRRGPPLAGGTQQITDTRGRMSGPPPVFGGSGYGSAVATAAATAAGGYDHGSGHDHGYSYNWPS